jgi:GTP-binding protein
MSSAPRALSRRGGGCQSSSAIQSTTPRARAPAAMLLRPLPSLLTQALAPPRLFCRAARRTISATAAEAAGTAGDGARPHRSARKLVKTALFLPPGVERGAEVPPDTVVPGSNIVVGPYAGDAKVKEAEFVGSSARARDCPDDDRPEFAVLGRSNVGKSSLINALTRRKEAALTSKKPGTSASTLVFVSSL